MQADHRAALLSFRCAQSFLREYGHVLPTVASTGLVQRLDGIIAAAYTHTTDRVLAEMRGHSLAWTEQLLRDDLLRDHLTPIVRIARADLPHTPEFRVLRMPAGRPSLDQLVGAARAMGAIAERFTGTFTAAGLHPGFVDALHAAIEAVLHTRDARFAAYARRRAAVDGLRSTIAEGRDVLDAIDCLLSTELRHDAARLAEWKSTIAKPRKLGRPRSVRRRRRTKPADPADPASS